MIGTTLYTLISTTRVVYRLPIPACQSIVQVFKLKFSLGCFFRALFKGFFSFEVFVFSNYFRSFQVLDGKLLSLGLSPEDVKWLNDLPLSITIPALRLTIVHAGVAYRLKYTRNEWGRLKATLVTSEED